MPTDPFHLAVALDGAGWHPAAWRAEGARPGDLFEAGYWVEQVAEAERGLLDFVTVDDSLAVQSARRGRPDDRVDQVRGRLDAVLVASRVAPTSERVGIVPVATTTHTEPFHVAKAVATLDWVSQGRAGVQVRVSSTAQEAAQFGRREVPDRWNGDRDDPAVVSFVTDLFDEATDFVEVMRRLWDSWEDGAEIRDAATGRFVDRDKLHYIDFTGRWFSVKGPSITPRSPQGQPVVACLSHSTVPYRLAATSADVVFVTPHDTEGVAAIESEVRTLEAEAGRAEPLRVLADLVVFLDDTGAGAAARRARLDELDGRAWRSDAEIFTGTPEELADLMESWRAVPGAGGRSALAGFRLRPATVPHDLEAVTRELVPVLQARGLHRAAYAESTLRARLGLDRPANRYATAAPTAAAPTAAAPTAGRTA